MCVRNIRLRGFGGAVGTACVREKGVGTAQASGSKKVMDTA